MNRLLRSSAMIIAFANAKGGCGKSTAAIHCAQVLHDAGRTVGLVDLDRQATARTWIEASAASDAPVGATVLPVVGHGKTAIPGAVHDGYERFDNVVIDAAPGGWPDLLHALHAERAGRPLVDVVIVPCRPMPFDWVQFIALRNELASDPFTRQIAVFGMLTQARANMSNYQDAADRMNAIDEHTGRPYGFSNYIPVREGELARIQFAYAPDPAADLYHAHERILRELEGLMEIAR